MKQTFRTWQSIFLGITVAVAAMLPAIPTFGQQAGGGDGRALDANQRVGSGGRNEAGERIDYRARNDVVTGNVGGGRAFQGDVDYVAPGEFRGQLGSDDLFRFQADSLSSSPQRLNAVSAQRGYVTGRGTGIYRPYTSLSNNQPLTAQRLGADQVIVDGLRGDTFYSQLGTGLVDIGRIGRRDTLGDTLGVGQVVPGRTLEVSASPLFGLRRTETETGTQFAPLLDTQRRTPDERPRRDGAEPGALADPAEEMSRALDQRLSQPSWLQGEPGRLAGIDSDAAAADRDRDRLAPTSLLGQRLRGLVGDSRSERGEDAMQRELAGLTDQFERQAQARDAGAPGMDPYADLLNAMRGQMEGDQRSDPLTDEQHRRESLLAGLNEPEESEVQRAERAREEAMQRLRERLGLTEEPTEAGDDAGQAHQPWQQSRTAMPGGDATVRDQSGQTEGAGADEALSSLMDQLNYDLPPLESLAGTRESRAASMMREAEERLRDGNYFAAEGLFRQVLIDRPDEPLARVGLVHAQLGAGMIRTAALNLRRLFESHPELIAARYEDHLLPSAERLEAVQAELQRMISTQDTPEPGLVLAYLGHQAGSRQLVRYGLATAEAQAPGDPLWPVLRHIWLEQRDREGDPASAAPDASGQQLPDNNDDVADDAAASQQ